MIPGYARIVICPHCKGSKPLLSLVSGNTFRGCQWWDLKEDVPMLPHVSWVQKCPHCGGYFMQETAKSRKGKDYSGERGQLDYPEMRQAWAQLKDSTKKVLREHLLLEYVWAYNDAFQRGCYHEDGEGPSDEDLAEFREVIRELIRVLDVKTPLVHAEFLREAGFFDEAMTIVEREEGNAEGVYKNLAEAIREKCSREDPTVGQVVF